MGSFTYLVKRCWHRLIPFVACIAVYASLVQFQHTGEWWTALVKCSPILSLMLFVLFFGFDNLRSNTFPRKIFAGLFFGAIGDVLLDIDLFEFGVGSFLIGQIFYIWAFGASPFMWWIGVILYVAASALVGILFPYMDEFARYGLPVYALFLTTMSWRALARIWALEDESMLLTKIICGIGSLLFVISDALIAFDRFYTKIPDARYYIMITYYAAQLGIALSVVPSKGQDTKLLIADAQTEASVEPDSRYGSRSSRYSE